MTQEFASITLNYNISFFILTKQIFGRERESRGLYILDSKVPKSIACSRVVSSFEVHCRLGHPSLSLLKKLYPRFSSVSSLNYDSCQYAKHHRVHLSPRVNK